MPKPKDERKVTELISAARKLVITTGFTGLKMADVAAQAGIATGTLYVYYKGKEDLINDVYRHTKSEVIATLLNPAHATGDFYTTFRNMWHAYFTFCYEQPEKMLFTEQFVYSGYIDDALIAEMEKQLEPMDQLIAYGSQQGILKPLPVDLVKAHLQGSIHEAVKTLRRLKQRITPTLQEQYFSLTWDGLKT